MEQKFLYIVNIFNKKGTVIAQYSQGVTSVSRLTDDQIMIEMKDRNYIYSGLPFSIEKINLEYKP